MSRVYCDWCGNFLGTYERGVVFVPQVAVYGAQLEHRGGHPESAPAVFCSVPCLKDWLTPPGELTARTEVRPPAPTTYWAGTTWVQGDDAFSGVQP